MILQLHIEEFYIEIELGGRVKVLGYTVLAKKVRIQSCYSII